MALKKKWFPQTNNLCPQLVSFAHKLTFCGQNFELFEQKFVFCDQKISILWLQFSFLCTQIETKNLLLAYFVVTI